MYAQLQEQVVVVSSCEQCGLADVVHILFIKMA